MWDENRSFAKSNLCQGHEHINGEIAEPEKPLFRKYQCKNVKFICPKN